MYKFHVRYIWFPCSRVLLSLWPRQQQPTTTRCCSSRLPRPVSLSSSLLLAHVSVSLSFHILAVAHTWRAYAYTCVCAPARSPLSHPSFLSPSLFRGICTVSHKRFTPVVVYKFFLPLSLRFSCISNSSSSLLALLFFVCLFFFFFYYYLNFEILTPSLNLRESDSFVPLSQCVFLILCSSSLLFVNSLCRNAITLLFSLSLSLSIFVEKAVEEILLFAYSFASNGDFQPVPLRTPPCFYP